MDARDPDQLEMPFASTPAGPPVWLRRRMAALGLALGLVLLAIGVGRSALHADPADAMPAIHVGVAGATLGRLDEASSDRLEVTRVPATEAIRVSTPSDVPTGWRVRETRLMEVTAYCPCRICCGPLAHGMTASGKPVSYNGGRFVAADVKLLPFGSVLSIPGYADREPVEVIDRGGMIRGERLDVFFPTHAEARRWGRQTLPIRVLEPIEQP
jgi:3D (Asp-Asp-Asp) domain-containing protein